EQTSRRLADTGIVRNRGKMTRQLPGLEERRPVDPIHQLGERISIQRLDAKEARLRNGRGTPVNHQPVGTRFGETWALLAAGPFCPSFTNCAVFLLDALHERLPPPTLAQEPARHT